MAQKARKMGHIDLESKEYMILRFEMLQLRLTVISSQNSHLEGRLFMKIMGILITNSRSLGLV